MLRGKWILAAVAVLLALNLFIHLGNWGAYRRQASRIETQNREIHTLRDRHGQQVRQLEKEIARLQTEQRALSKHLNQLQREIERVQNGEFFKPQESEHKLFLSRVKDDSFQCELLLGKIPEGTKVVVSEAVHFLSEY